jgi:hypothetical protein
MSPMPCFRPLELQLPSALRHVVELSVGHADLVFGCAHPGGIDCCIDFDIDDSPVGKLRWVGRSRRIPTPRIGRWGSRQEVHICSLENESNLLRFNLPIYTIHTRPKGGGMIVSGGLVRHEGGGGGGESEELAVEYTLSDSGPLISSYRET